MSYIITANDAKDKDIGVMFLARERGVRKRAQNAMNANQDVQDDELWKEHEEKRGN